MRRTLFRSGSFVAVLAVGVIALAAPVELGSAHGTWRIFTTRDGLPGDSIREIRVVDGDVWVGTDTGLARRDGDGWVSWTTADGLPDAAISAIEFDPRTGDLWLGTWGAGLVRFTGGRFDRFDQFSSGLAGDLIFDVAVVDGQVWTAGNGGVSLFEPLAGRWDLQLEPRADRVVPAVTDLLQVDERIHAGSWCGPLLRYDPVGDVWSVVADLPVAETRSTRDLERGGESVLTMAPGGSSVWWTSNGRLFRRERGEPWPGAQIERPEAARGFVNCLAARNDREVWLGTDAGLQILSDRETSSWLLYGSDELPPMLPDPRVRCLAFEGDAVWVGTPRGLVHGTGRSPSIAAGAVVAGGRPEGEARIGVLGPFTRPVPLPGASSPWPTPPVDRVAVARAVERINERLRGSDRILALADNVVSFTRYGWVTAQDSYPMLRDRHRVHGLVGYFETDARMETAVALRTQVPVVNIAPTDPTADETLNPWVFRCAENDPRLPMRLLDHVFDTLGRVRPALLRTPGNQSRERLARWSRYAAARGHAIVAEIECDPDVEDLSAQIEELKRSRADVLLTWADARSTGTLVRKLRAAGLDQLLVGGDRIAGPEFLEITGPDPGRVIALARCPHFEVTGDLAPLDEELRRRRPDIARKTVLPQSGRSFDAAMHLAAAIERAGPDRETIRQMLAKMGHFRVARPENGVWVVVDLETAESP